MKKSELRQIIREEFESSQLNPRDKDILKIIEDEIADLEASTSPTNMLYVILDDIKSYMLAHPPSESKISYGRNFPKIKDQEDNTDWRDTGEMGG